MPDVKCCSDIIQPPQNLSSDRLRGHQSRGWSAPSADTGEQRQGCPLHQGVSVQAWRNSIRKRFSFYSRTLPRALLRVVISTRYRQIWKTHLSDAQKNFSEKSPQKSLQSPQPLGKGEKGTQGIIHSPSSPQNQMLFFPWQCNWKALISASRTGKMTDLKHFPQHCPHLFLVNLFHKAPVPHLQ